MKEPFFLSVCLNPTLQKTIVLSELRENEVNRSSEYYLDASGKGINVSRVLTQLGEKSVHLTQAGGINRELFLILAEKDNLVVKEADSRSEIRFCYTLVNKKNSTSTEIVEEAEKVSPDVEAKILNLFDELLPETHTLIISGTKAKGFSDGLYPQMVKKAKESGKAVILDYRGKDLIDSLTYRPDVIKPNFFEFCRTFFPEQNVTEHGSGSEILERVQEKMLDLYRKLGVITVITRGAMDTLYIEGDTVKTREVERIQPVNTIGCGDAFTAGLAASFHRGESASRRVENGIRCASLNAMQIRPGVIRS